MISVPFTGSYDQSQEALQAAAPFMEKPSARLIRTAHFWGMAILATIGIAALLYLITGKPEGLGIIYLLIGAIIISFGLLMLPARLDKQAFKLFEQSAFLSNTSVEITETAFSLITPDSRWDTGWGDVTEIFRTPNTIGIIAPTGPIYFSAAATDDPTATFARMKTWHHAAKAAR